MEADVKDDLSGNFRSLMVGLINGGRDESEDVDEEKVKEDAKVNSYFLTFLCAYSCMPMGLKSNMEKLKSDRTYLKHAKGLELLRKCTNLFSIQEATPIW